MKRLLSLLLFCAITTAAVAQQPQSTTTAQPAYGMAQIEGPTLGNKFYLILQDGTTPNAKFEHYEENGKDRFFADEAAVLNFLADRGWEVIPNPLVAPGSNSRYLLRRRSR